MPKIKTHSASKKRFKITANGKVKRSKAYTSHLFNSKSPKRKRNLRKGAIADVTNAAVIKRLIPYM
jgi:large subunit ribosomal protein L35